MDLYNQITRHFDMSQNYMLSKPVCYKCSGEIVSTASFYALNKIREIIRDDSLSDKSCFYKIEEIVKVFE